MARGSDKPGRISKGAGQRGNPRAFLEALGGLAACCHGKAQKPKISIERLTTPVTNGYGDAIRRAKGLALVSREQVRVKKGAVDKDTGEIFQRSGPRSVKQVLASVVTRLAEWVLLPKITYAFARQAAQDRAHQRDAATTPAGLGKQALQHFWATLWQAWEARSPEERHALLA